MQAAIKELDVAVNASTLSSGSGITIDGTQNVDLGGNLDAPATITTAAGLDLSVDGAGQFISNAGVTSLQSNTINLGDAAGDVINAVGSLNLNQDLVFNEATNDLTIAVADQGSAAVTVGIPDLSGGAPGDFVFTTHAQTFSLKQFFDFSNFFIDDGNPTRRARFELNGITAGTDRVYDLPDQDGTIALTSDLTGAGLWTDAAPDIYYNTGNVGIGTTAPNASLQIGNAFTFERFVDNSESINSDVIASNIRFDKTSPTEQDIFRIDAGQASIISLENGNISFLRVLTGAANSQVLVGTQIDNWMDMENDGTVTVTNSLGVGQNIFFPEGTDHTIEVEASTSGAGNNLLIGAADGQTSVGDGGSAILFGGAGFDFGGIVNLAGGAATNASGIGGDIQLTPGTGPNPANNGIVEVVGTSAFLLPIGNDSQRPIAPVDGMMRYSNEVGFEGFEFYDGGWFPLGGGADLTAVDTDITFVEGSPYLISVEPNTSGIGDNLQISAGGSTSTSGGNLILSSGFTGTAGNGGNVDIDAVGGPDNGGNVTIDAGSAGISGGGISLTAGNGSTGSGNIALSAGDASSAPGGNITLTPGIGNPSNGVINLNGNTSLTGGLISDIFFDDVSRSIAVSDNTSGSGAGPNLTLNAGGTTSGAPDAGGNLNLNAGSSLNGSGGKIVLTAGNTSAATTFTGGNIELTPGLGASAAEAGFVDIVTTSALKLPSGTTGDRVGVGREVPGMIRYNTTIGQFEGYDGAWNPLGGGGSGVTNLTTDITFLPGATRNITVNANAANGDDLVLNAGAGLAGTGGNLNLNAGSGTLINNGGGINITGGNTVTGTGGNIELTPGIATGIGTDGKVIVNDAFQYIDGTEANGFVLTSDAAGNASWQAPTGGFTLPVSDAGFNIFDNAGGAGSKGITNNITDALEYESNNAATAIILEQGGRLNLFSFPAGIAGNPISPTGANGRLSIDGGGVAINGDTPQPGVALDVRAAGSTVSDILIFDDGADASSDATLTFRSNNGANTEFTVGVDADGNQNFVIAESGEVGSANRMIIERGTGNIRVENNLSLANAANIRVEGDGLGGTGRIILEDGQASPLNLSITTPANMAASYNLIMPGDQGIGALTNDGAGNLAWVPAAGGDFTVDANENNYGANIANLPTGANNVFLGLGVSNAGVISGSDNILIGTNTNNTSLTTGGNVAIGAAAQSSGGDGVAIGTDAISNGTNAIAIGNASAADANNSVAIGTGTVATNANTIILGDGAPLFNVGINTATPGVELDVNGDADVSGRVTASSYVLSAPVQKFYGITPSEFSLVQESPADDNELRVPDGNIVFVDAGAVDAGAQIAAPVHLPQGAELVDIEVFGRNTSGIDMTVRFIEKSYSTASTDVGSVTIGGAVGGITPFSLAGVNGYPINNQTDNYLILIDIPTRQADIAGVRISYVIGTAE